MISCPICRGTETHKMDCQNATYVERLQAERDVLHGALMKAGGLADVDRWPERYPLVYGCMTDAIKEVE